MSSKSQEGDFISKQEFIIKTLTFIANSIFINIFAKIFGMSNSIVAVAIVVIALTLVAADLRENIIKKTFYISMVMLTMGVSSTLMNINPFWGIVVNVPIIFFIIYEGVNSYKENMYFPFLLAYIFMGLSAPADIAELPIRMVAIVVGCIYILIIQLVLNKDRFNKTVVNTKKQLILMVINKIDCILDKKEINLGVNDVYQLTKPIVRAIYDTRLKGKVISTRNKGYLSIVLSIENLYKEICKISKNISTEDIEVLKKIKMLLTMLNEYFYGNGDKSIVKNKISLLVEEIDNYTKYKELVKISENLCKSIEVIESKQGKINDKLLHIKNGFKPIDTNSRSFKFAMKLSLSVSIMILLVDVFNITYGRWIIFPMIAIIQPYSDGTVKKSIDRVIGTVIGIIVFVIIFTLVRDNMVRLNITIFLAYINLFMKKYHISTSLVAVSALGSVAMGGAGIEILIWRIIFTVLGCAIGLMVNRYIYSCNLKEYVEEIAEEYNCIIEKLDKLDSVYQNETKIYDSILKIKLIEYTLTQHNKCILGTNVKIGEKLAASL